MDQDIALLRRPAGSSQPTLIRQAFFFDNVENGLPAPQWSPPGFVDTSLAGGVRREVGAASCSSLAANPPRNWGNSTPGIIVAQAHPRNLFTRPCLSQGA